MRRVLLLSVVAVVTVGCPAIARAQIGVPSKVWRADTWPTQAVLRTLTIPEGSIEIVLPAYLASITQSDGQNLYGILPEVEYGATQFLTVGVSQMTIDCVEPLTAGHPCGTSLVQPSGFDCGLDGANCPSRFDYQTITAHAVLRFGPTDAGLFADVPFHLFDPTRLGADAGVTARFLFGPMFAARFRGGVALDDLGGANDTGVIASLELIGQVTPILAIGASTGAQSLPRFAMPVHLTMQYGLAGLDVFAAVGTPRVEKIGTYWDLTLGVNLWR